MIHLESWHKEADERGLQSLLKSHQANPSLETATGVWRTYLRLGKLPPLEYGWVEELEAAGETMPKYTVRSFQVLYGYDESGEEWVTWGPERGVSRWLADPSSIRGWVRNVPTWYEDLLQPEFFEESNEVGKALIKFEQDSREVNPAAFGHAPPYSQSQQDYLLEIDATPEDARQLFRWVQE